MHSGLGGCLCHSDKVGSRLGWQRRGGGHARDIPIVQEEELCSRERSMRQTLGQPSPPHQPCPWVTFASGDLLQQELLCAGTDGCGVTGRRRRWGMGCCPIYMPSAEAVLGQVHQGVCVRAEMQSRLVRSA